jgi:hypothetical protein
MSSKRTHSPNFPLCRFAFADGRHCAHPAHPQWDGLCPSHNKALHRSRRSKDPARHLSPLSWKYLDESDVKQILANLPDAVDSQAISSGRASALRYLGNVLICSIRDAKVEALREGRGRHWDAIRKLLDDRDAHPAPDS